MSIETQLDIIMRDGVPVIRITGSFDHDAIPVFRSVMSELATNNCKKLVLDMSAVDFVDSGGISGVIYAIKQMSAIGGRVFLVNCNPRTERKLTICGLTELSDVLVICASVNQALETALEA